MTVSTGSFTFQVMDGKKNKPTWIRTKKFPPNLCRNRHSGIYYLRTSVGGKDKWLSLKTDIFEVAKFRLKDRMEQFDAARVSGLQPDSGPLLFERALAIFQSQLQASELQPNTKAFYQMGVKLITRSWPEIKTKDVARITTDDVVAWLQGFVDSAVPYVPPRAKSAARNTTGASVTTLKCALGTLRQILDVAVLSKHLSKNPARQEAVILKMRKQKKKIRRERSKRRIEVNIPSREDFAKLVEMVRKAGVSDCRAAADFIEFIAYCGARKNEAINVQWRDIDFVVGAKPDIKFKGGAIHLRVTKSGESRSVPMFGNMRTLLERVKNERVQPKQTDPVLLVKEAQGFITSGCRKLGIPRFTTHGLRHYFGTTCLEQGVDAPTVAKWLGHSDNGALLLRTYTHVRPDHEKLMINKVDLAGPRDNQTPQ